MKQPCQIVWFKRDLRVIDHKPLLEASKTNIPTLPVYIFETDYWKQPILHKNTKFIAPLGISSHLLKKPCHQK